MKTYHSLERTSPKGQKFIGTCQLCGKQNLTLEAAATGECPNTRGLTATEALLEAVEHTKDQGVK